MKVIVLQPTVPGYRLGFFRRLHHRFGPAFTVYASERGSGISAHDGAAEVWEHRLGAIVTLLPGLHWQRGVLSIPFSKADVIVVSGNPRYLSTLALLLKARWTGARTIWWGHYWSSTSSPARARLRLLLTRVADAVLFYTDNEVSEYLASRGDRGRRIAALNNGLEIEPIERLRADYRAADRPRRLLFVGRLTRKTEFQLLLESLARPECSGVHLDVIGPADGSAGLRRLAASLGIGERVTWHGGISDEAKIAEIANRCRLFFYPGSVGLSLIHGLAYGLPAVVHDDRWSHMPEVAAFRDGTNGLAFRKGDAGSAASVVSRLVDDVTLLNAFSRAATATVTTSFNASDMAARFIRLIERMRPQEPLGDHRADNARASRKTPLLFGDDAHPIPPGNCRP